jgi:hypothetical protein
MFTNKSTLLTILGAALIGATKSKSKGSSSNPLRSRLKVAGYPDGMFHITAEIRYRPMGDSRNQGGVAEYFFDLPRHINPAIQFLDALKTHATERNIEDVNDIVDEVATMVGVRLYNWEGDLVEEGDVDSLPSIPAKLVEIDDRSIYEINEWEINERVIEWRLEDAVDRVGWIIQDFQANGGDLFTRFDEEGYSWLADELGIEEDQEDVLMYIDDIEQNYEEKLNDFYQNSYEISTHDHDMELDSEIEHSGFKIDFVFDPAQYPWMMEWSKDDFETEIKAILHYALDIYHGYHQMGRNWDGCSLGEVQSVTVEFKELSKVKSELRKF